MRMNSIVLLGAGLLVGVVIGIRLHGLLNADLPTNRVHVQPATLEESLVWRKEYERDNDYVRGPVA